ncbi:MAG: flagellar hook-length control protein FliK [Alphaproteobacteria bacterium]
MDVSVRKYNAQTNPSAAANFVPKIEPGATSDAFLSILSQVRVSASAEESAEKVFSRISQTANAAHSIKKAEKPKAAVPANRTEYVKSKPSSPAEKPRDSSKPATGTKTDTPDGQKIPAEENNARTENTGKTENESDTPADAPTPETGKENGTAVKADGKDDSVETETVLTLGAAAAAVPAAAAAVQAAAVQNAGETFNAEKTLETVPGTEAISTPISGDKPAETDGAVPEALKPQEVLPETDAAAVPEMEAKVAEAVQNGLSSAEKGEPEADGKDPTRPAVNTGHKQETIPEEVVKRVVEEFDPQTEKAASATPEMTAPSPEKAGRTDSRAETDLPVPQTAQADDLAAKLPENAKIAVQVKTNTPENTAVRTAPEEEAGLADETVPVKPTHSETTAKTGNTAPAATTSETARNGNDTGRNPDMGDGNRQMPNAGVLPNAGAGAAQTAQGEQTFAAALKTSAAEGVSAVSGNSAAGTTDGAQPLFNVPGESLKGKAVAGTAPAPKASVPTNELVDQIKVSITKAAREGLEKININLKPKELGNIQVRLEVDSDGNMKASIIASRPETLDMLQKDASVLRQALQDAGLKTNDNAFSFSYRGDQQPQQEAGRFAGNDRRHDGGQDIPLNGADAAATDDDLTEAIIASGWTGRHALNIRV